MKVYWVRWRGTITRDVGTDEVTADTPAEATEAYKVKHPNREVVYVGERVLGHPLSR